MASGVVGASLLIVVGGDWNHGILVVAFQKQLGIGYKPTMGI